MCGRTSLSLPQAVVESRFDAEATEPLHPRYNIAPFEALPVITDTSPDAIDQFEWGFLPEWAEDPDATYRPINARGETLAEKPMFRDAFASRRCLVLADGFYEWQERESGGSQPYRVKREDEEPFAMAGLWSQWTDDGTALETVTIVTTEANAVLEPIHDRMPVVLPPEREREWLVTGSEDAAADLLASTSDPPLAAYPVSTAVNDPKNDSAAILEPVDPEGDTQTGLDEFG